MHAASSTTDVAASDVKHRKLRGINKKNFALEEDVEFWTNLQRNMQYMSLPDRPMNSNSVIFSSTSSTSLVEDEASNPPTTTAPDDDDDDDDDATIDDDRTVFPTETETIDTTSGETQAPTDALVNADKTPSISLTMNKPTPSPTIFEATPFPTQDMQRSTTPKTFVCPDASFVGCTSPNSINPDDECDVVGELCDGDDGLYCCQDDCPRNYCTAMSG